LLLTVLVLVAGCSDAEDRLNATVRGFVDALSRGDAPAAAALTGDQTAASDTLGKLYASLGTDVRFEATETAHEDNAATFTLAAT
ncbi:penicillin-binding protein, partial [Mycobacterium sp. ITM-2017-0098]